MIVAGLYRCDAPGTVYHMGHNICGESEDIEPVFTMALAKATKKFPQPVWRCPEHLKKIRPVWALTGAPKKRRR